MFGTFDKKTETVESIAQAKIFFGSSEETKSEIIERKSPFDGTVVSLAPV